MYIANKTLSCVLSVIKMLKDGTHPKTSEALGTKYIIRLASCWQGTTFDPGMIQRETNFPINAKEEK